MIRTLLAVLLLIGCLGCKVGQAPVASDPFDSNSACHQHCEGGRCHPCCDPNCRTALDAALESIPIDQDAAKEVKDGNCLRCPQSPVTTIQPRIIAQTGVTPISTTIEDKDRPREGAFACYRCGRRTVGDEFFELWADDGTPLTCVCRQCWRAMGNAERKAQLEAYAAKSNLSESQLFHVRNAIREATATK